MNHTDPKIDLHINMNKTLLLVDGSSYLYRAFHALPNMRNVADEPTGALYGILNMLKRLRTEMPSAYLACIFDAKGNTFRDVLYAHYKATRPPMPTELQAQIIPIHAAIRAMGWPILMVEGIEADDVIGTVATQATAIGLNVIVSSGDKDLAQLVNDQITIINTMNDERLDYAGVLEKFHVYAEQIIDYLTLIGDTVDNIPGVAKVGPKTAVKWLTQYGSLDSIMKHAADIGGVVGDNLRATLDWLPQARQLITIKTDCDLSAHITDITTDLLPKTPDWLTLIALFKKYNFKTWLKEATQMRQATSPHAISSLQAPYECILTNVQLQTWREAITAAELTALDTETTALNPMQAQLVGIALSCKPGVAAYIPLTHHDPHVTTQLSRDYVLAVLRPWLEDEHAMKVVQNLKYDTHVLANHGIILRGTVHDTLLQSYVLESHHRHSIDNLALRHLNTQTISFESVCGKGASQITFDQVPIDQAYRYAAEDADITYKIHAALWPQLQENPSLAAVYQLIEIPTTQVLLRMERKGVLINAQELIAQSETLGKRLFELKQQAHTLAERTFNLNSPKQISEILFDKLKLPVIKKTPAGVPSTNEDVLQKLAQDYPLPLCLLEHRRLSKLKSTYTDKLPKMVNSQTGRVHTHYAQAIAVTGRLASNDPNLQNIPARTAEGRKIREAFIAPPGYWIVSADYSQIELRIMAHLSEDPVMLRAFAHGIDIHNATAAEIFSISVNEVNTEQRRTAKVINFGLIYGMSAFGLANTLSMQRDAAQAYIDRYFQRFSGVKRYMDMMRTTAAKQGYVETVFGRRLWLPEIHSPNMTRRSSAERAAINAPMQGTAADLIKLSMIVVQQWITSQGLRSALIMQVHDELVLEVPESELSQMREHLPQLMAKVARLKVPLAATVGVGKNWEEAH